jgi:c-di-AMP phosphodiesterase-like protein
MSFISLSVIVIVTIIISIFIISLMRSIIYMILLGLVFGIMYYIFLASPTEKMKMDQFANNLSEKIYKIDNSKVNNIIDNAKVMFKKAQDKVKTKIEEIKTKK